MGTELDAHIIGDAQEEFEDECFSCGGLIEKFGDDFICYTCEEE